jgi:putative phosphoribosyl transferase
MGVEGRPPGAGGHPGGREDGRAGSRDDVRDDQEDEPDEPGRFRDRREAGERLGAALMALHGPQTVVVALPRGGVEVGFEVARALEAPLDIWVVRKIGVPGHEELGLGAVAEGGYTHLSPEIVAATGIPRGELARLCKRKLVEVERRTQLLRAGHARVSVADKVVVLVDDGIATGGTIRAVAGALRREGPARLVLGVPVAAADTIEALSHEFDEVVCLEQPVVLHAVGLWYDDFGQVDDQEVIALLAAARRTTAPAGDPEALRRDQPA